MGFFTAATGANSTSLGNSTAATGASSTAMGLFTEATGVYSTALGINTTAKSNAETAIGAFNTNYTPNSSTGWNATDRLFIIGNGIINATSDAMVVLKNGNTGIGISTPTYKLHVGNNDNSFRIEGPALSGSGGTALSISSKGRVDVDAPFIGGGRFTIKENGNVGIAMSDPTEKLEVVGKIKTSSLQITSGAANGNLLMSDINGNASWQTPAVPVNYWTASGGDIYNNNAGNVGIGILSPHAPLQFANTTVNRKVVFFETGANDHQYYGFGVNIGILRYQTSTLADDHVFYAAASATSSNELMRIKGNGNVGIGTSAPNAALQFSNNPANRKIVLYEDANNDHQFNGFGFNASALRYQVNKTSDDHVFYAGTSPTTSNELFRIKGNGNVGIGNAAPTSKLQVDGAIRLQGSQTTHAQGLSLEWNNNSGSGASYLLNNKGLGGGGFILGEVDNANNITHRLDIDQNGNVGIGNAAPISTLDVNGTIATKVNYRTSNSGTVPLDNTATVWIFGLNVNASIQLPNPFSCPNRRYTIANRNNTVMPISNYYNLSGTVVATIPAFSSIELISGGASWEQIR